MAYASLGRHQAAPVVQKQTVIQSEMYPNIVLIKDLLGVA